MAGSRGNYPMHELHKLQPSQQISSKLRRMFEEIDKDKGGRISRYEFDNFINNLPTNQINRDAWRELINDADRNQDRYIDIDEFNVLMQSILCNKAVSRVWFDWYITKVAGRNALYRSGEETDGEYRDAIRYCPPPLGMISASAVEVTLFLYILFYYGEECDMSNPVYQELAYNPRKRNEVWRDLTYMLVHHGWEHLAGNVLMQLIFGFPLELVHRWWRILLIYLVGVLSGALGTSLVDPTSFLVGASAGVYALLCAHISTIVLNWSEMEHPAIMLLLFVSYMSANTGSAIYESYNSEENSKIKVGYASHFFGALSGILFGLCVLRNLKVHRWETELRAISAIILLLFFAVAIIWNIYIPGYFLPLKD